MKSEKNTGVVLSKNTGVGKILGSCFLFSTILVAAALSFFYVTLDSSVSSQLISHVSNGSDGQQEFASD